MIAFAAEPFPGTFWPVGKSSLKCGICTSLNFPPLSSFGAPTEHQRCDYCPQHLGGMNQVNSRNEMQPESAFECDDGYNRAVEEARTAVASHRGSQDALLDGYLDLAINLFSRFERFGRTEDAEESLFWERQALQLASDSHPDRPMFLNNLCVSLLTLHEAQKSKRLDSHKDYLSEAIDIGSSAIVAAGSHHPSLPLYHHTLSTAFITRYEDGQGCDSDLQEAIRLSQFAVQATADTPPDSWTATYRHGLSKALMQSYAHTEDLHDLDEAISLLRGAVKVEDLADIGRAPFHSSLAVALLRRYERRGILHDLEEGFELAGMAFEATPSDHPAFNKRRLNYCNALWLHYERFQELAYLDLAILYLYTATSECDLDPVTLQYSYLSLSVALVTRYEGARDKEDAEQAVNAARAANALVTTQNDVPIYLSNLGTTLLTLYECSDNVLHLEEALTCALRAVERRTQSREASETGRYFGSLSVCYYRRWQRLQQQEDLEQCVTFSRRAIDEEGALPHPLSAQWMVNLSRGLLELWSIRQCNESLINEAYELLRRVSTSYNFSSIVPHSVRFDAAERWATHASSCDRLMDALEAYRVAHNIIPQLIWIGKDTRTRNELLTRIAGLAADAAACAIAAQELKLAVEFLEQGRNVFWQQMFQLRTNLDPLRKVDADLADEVHAAAGLLGTIDQRVYIVPDSSSGLPPWISDNAERRRAARDWEQLLERVRQIEGFSDFLLPPCYDRLRLAASRGPVVLLNCSKMRCDALILLSPDDLVKHVPLGSITLETVGRMRQIMSGLARIAPSRLETPILDRKAQLGHTAVFSLNEMLSELQKAVVKPVLAEIESSVVDSRRIWWCPVGIFASLPIHGAMLYRGDQIHTNPESADDLDYVVSSYAPTLSLLVAESKASQKPPAILAIGVPASNVPNIPCLPGVTRELAVMRSIIPKKQMVTLEGNEATVEAVTGALPDYTWAHFACHGKQSIFQRDVMRSSLILQDDHLDLSRIMQISLPNAEVALMTACESATGDIKLSDEAMHLAGGMIYAGFHGVVATMYLFSASPDATDSHGGANNDQIREQTYSERAAEALHHTVKQMRDSGVPPYRWCVPPFVELG